MLITHPNSLVDLNRKDNDGQTLFEKTLLDNRPDLFKLMLTKALPIYDSNDQNYAHSLFKMLNKRNQVLQGFKHPGFRKIALDAGLELN